MKTLRTFILGFVVGAIVLAAALFVPRLPQKQSATEIPLADVVAKIEAGEIKKVVQKFDSFELLDKQENKFFSRVEESNDALKTLVMSRALEKGVQQVESEAQAPPTALLFGSLTVFNVFTVVWLGISLLIFVLLLQLIIGHFTRKR